MNDDCLKLTTYFGERHRTEDRFVADALLDVYGRTGVELSMMLRAAPRGSASSTTCAPIGC